MKTNKLPDGVSLAKLDENFRVAASEYSRAHGKCVKLDATDKGRLWEAVKAKFPTYQILPDTNHVSYVKQNILASLYTVGKSANLIATSDDDRAVVANLNIAMDKIWSTLKVGWFQMQAGERAALLNLGITQVGWDNSVINNDPTMFEKGKAVLKNVDPLKYMRDPFSTDLDNAGYCMTWDHYHKSVILANPNYKEAFEDFLKTKTESSGTDLTPNKITDRSSQSTTGKKDYYKIVTHWVRVGSKIHEIHTVDNKFLLYIKEDIQPAMFPFAELYCNLPAGDLIGTSEPAKIFSNSLVYNIMNSIIATSEYKNQRPPRFISKQSMLNVDTFTKHGNDADKAFIVNGDASKAVHYHQFPQPTAASTQTMSFLARDIQQVTGVDDKYTGRDTGSILTTGGIDSMLDQVTMIDAPKIECYENYSTTLTKLILYNYIQHSAISRKYFIEAGDGSYKTVTVDFPKIDAATVFDYELAISSELPKTKSRLEAAANKIMQMQMQYKGAGIEVDLIQPEEWLQFLDIPMRELMLERMKIQRHTNYVEKVAQVLEQYTSLVQQGMAPDDALYATAETLRGAEKPGMNEEDALQETMMMLGGGAGGNQAMSYN